MQGVFRDKERTAQIAPPHGITVSLLHTGTSYDDTFDDEGGLYHYPSTDRAGRDRAEIEATKNAALFRVPVFIVLRGAVAGLGEVRRAWISDWDDQSRVFLISFGSEPEKSPSPKTEKFSLRAERKPVRALTGRPRPGQARFRFSVFKQYGPRCALCGMAIQGLLEAVHLCAVSDGGCDDPRNGLVLCRNHHRALDEKLFCFDPATGRVTCRTKGPTATELAISLTSLRELPAQPHPEALSWCWAAFCRCNVTPGG